ncbi:hypothetical protein J4447_00580 [Candidatus Pacearchaeota archaeon]|nr:hypothetical protein [Candidatus Pacearchaeota archaeon]
MGSSNDRDNKIGSDGYHAGRDGDSWDDLAHGLTKGFGGRDSRIYDKNYGRGASDRSKYGRMNSDSEPRSSSEGSSSGGGGGGGGGGKGCGCLGLLASPITAYFIFWVLPNIIYDAAVNAFTGKERATRNYSMPNYSTPREVRVVNSEGRVVDSFIYSSNATNKQEYQREIEFEALVRTIDASRTISLTRMGRPHRVDSYWAAASIKSEEGDFFQALDFYKKASDNNESSNPDSLADSFCRDLEDWLDHNPEGTLYPGLKRFIRNDDSSLEERLAIMRMLRDNADNLGLPYFKNRMQELIRTRENE